MRLFENLEGVETKYNFPLSGVTFFRIGGEAAVFFVPYNEQALILLVKALRQERERFYILGAGSNVLISDEGVQRPVIKLGKGFDSISRKDCFMEAGAAALLSEVLTYCARENLGGLEQFCGIPETIGGLAVMNASSFGKNILSVVEKVEVLDIDGRKKILGREQIKAGYRHSSLKDYIVTRVTFILDESSQVKEKAGAFF